MRSSVLLADSAQYWQEALWVRGILKEVAVVARALSQGPVKDFVRGFSGLGLNSGSHFLAS